MDSNKSSLIPDLALMASKLRQDAQLEAAAYGIPAARVTVILSAAGTLHQADLARAGVIPGPLRASEWPLAIAGTNLTAGTLSMLASRLQAHAEVCMSTKWPTTPGVPTMAHPMDISGEVPPYSDLAPRVAGIAFEREQAVE